MTLPVRDRSLLVRQVTGWLTSCQKRGGTLQQPELPTQRMGEPKAWTCLPLPRQFGGALSKPALEVLPGAAHLLSSLSQPFLPSTLCVPASQSSLWQLAGHAPYLWAFAHACSLLVWLTHPFFGLLQAFPDTQQGQVTLCAAHSDFPASPIGASSHLTAMTG